MEGSQVDRLQERVGEQLGTRLMLVGVVVLVVGIIGLKAGVGVFTKNLAQLSTVLVVLGALMLLYGGWRYANFRKGPAYAKYVSSKRDYKIAQIDAERVAPSQQPQPLIKEREVVRTEVVVIKCSYCGTLNNQTAKNCSSCGARM